MSEDKQREKLQKERAKLLEATFITPPNAEKQIENGPTSLPETEKPKKERTRMRVPIVRRRRKNENRNEINSNDVKDDSSLTPFQVYYFSTIIFYKKKIEIEFSDLKKIMICLMKSNRLG